MRWPQGQHEIDFKYAEALPTADNIMTFKLAVKTLAQKNGLHATFMPKPIFGINGSRHAHQYVPVQGRQKRVLTTRDGRQDAVQRRLISFIAGLLHHIRGMAAITEPAGQLVQAPGARL